MVITKLQDSEGGEKYEAEIAAKNKEYELRINQLYKKLMAIPGSDVLRMYTNIVDKADEEKEEARGELNIILKYLVSQSPDYSTNLEGLTQKILTEDEKEYIKECFLAVKRLLEKKGLLTLEDMTEQWFKDRCNEYGFDESTASSISLNKLNMGLPGTLIKERYLAPLRKLVDLNQKTLDLIIEACQQNNKNPHPLVMVDILRTQKTDLSNADFDKIRQLYALAHGSKQMEDYLDLHLQNPSAPAEAIKYMQLFTNKHRGLGYVLRRHIASGATKHVFEAEDPQCPEDKFVIKIFNLKRIRKYMQIRGEIPNFNEQHDIIGHEKKAAYISRCSNNQNISMVRVIQPLDDEGTYYMVEDRFEETLEDYVERCKNTRERTQDRNGTIIDLRTISNILTGICNGLQGFHINGLAHGDLKASNIGIGLKDPSKLFFLEPKEQVKITDCGYATSFKYNPEDKTFSLTGLSVRAPELYTKSEDRLVHTTQKSDIWAVGVLLYYMLTGEYPFLHPEKKQRQENYKQTEERVLDDIMFRLENPDKRIFNREIFNINNMTISAEERRKIDFYRRIISTCLKSEPKRRAHISGIIPLCHISNLKE